MNAISVSMKAAFALSGAAMFVVAQSVPNLSARELFFVPAEVTSTKKASPPLVSKAQTPAPAQKAQPQVASKKSTPVQPKEIRTDNEVRLVTANYSGPRPLGLKYSILKQDAPRQFKPVNVDSIFKSGDSIRV